MKIITISIRSWIHILVLWVTLALVASGFAQTHSVELGGLMKTLANRGQLSSAVLVAENGRMVYAGGFGEADVKRHIRFTAETPVYLASLTKQFTAMAVMLLAERGKLSYSDALSKYFPEFPTYAQKITIRHLLNHTSGIPDYVGLGMEHPGLADQEVLATLIKQRSPDFGPGGKWRYSNSGYILLALIIEKVSRKPYADFLKERIFRPLGMKNTFVFDKTKASIARAHGYNRFGDDLDYDLLTYGEGGIYSTVDDLFKWDRALYTDKLVKRSTLAEAFTPGKLNDGSPTSYGFGWGISGLNGQQVYSHAGRYGGFDTYIKRFPQERSTIIFLTNHDFKNMGAVGNAIIAVLHDQPYTLPKLSIAETMYKTYRTTGIEAAVKQYRSLKQATDYDFDESELNELGYELLAKNKTQDAIEILKLNVEAYPTSWNVYDGLGEAYMKNGNKELAIENYKKSLELNPNNTNAASILKKLASP